MAKRQRKKDPRVEADESVEIEAQERQQDPEHNSRDAQLADDEDLREALLELYNDAEAAFSAQSDRSDDIMDYWDLYNCKTGPKQIYAGNSRLFVPIVHNAVEARKTRFTNQVFPQTGRYVDVVSSGDTPNDIVALLEHYIRKDHLRTRVMPALMKNGDVEGQYNVYISWVKTKREVMFRAQRPIVMDGAPVPGTEGDEIVTEVIEGGRPHAEVLADSDVAIFPQTADTIEQALDEGGGVAIIRRWSKATIKKKIKSKEITEKAGEALIEALTDAANNPDRDKAKAMVDAAGIKIADGKWYAQVYEVWSLLTRAGERRIYVSFFGGTDNILSCKRNPYWCDKVPVLSCPVDRVQGSIKGISKLKPCADMQYAANDAVNEGMDSAAFSLLPIIMTDPQKNPRIGTMVLNLAAIWETNPNDTQFAKFPELWRSAFEIVNACRTEIYQTLSVSPAIMPQSTSLQAKRNQAEIAQEQQVDILSTADAVTGVEEGILTPWLNWAVELDHQYRDKAITVRQYGEMGVRANMEEIKPIQMETRYEFRWFGVEAARNQQQIQQQIAAINVVRGIPPEQYAPYELNLRPVISLLINNTFNSRLAPEIFRDPRSQLSQDPQFENQLLAETFDIPVHPLDDDAMHIQVHQQMLAQGDPSGVIRLHLMKHIQQLSAKTQMQQMQTQQGMPGVPGGQGPGGPQPAPGVAGTPRPGAQPAPPRGGQNPPGAIHQDRMQGAGVVPRR